MSLVFRNSWRKVRNIVEEKFLGIFEDWRHSSLKLAQLSHTESKLQNSWLVGKLVTRAIWWHDIEFLLVCLFFHHLVIFKKVWFMLLGFSCDGTCLSWIEFIFDLSCEPLYWCIFFKSLWRIWWWCCITLCYDMIHFMMIMHIHSMMLMHSYTISCTCIP